MEVTRGFADESTSGILNFKVDMRVHTFSPSFATLRLGEGRSDARAAAARVHRQQIGHVLGG